MSNLVLDHAVGVIVYHDFLRERKFLILKHRKGHWSYAKGHSDPGETEFLTARRELHEEAGIDDVEFLGSKVLLWERYSFTTKKGKTVKKEVAYFIAKSNTESVKVDNNEITAFKWCSLEEARIQLTFSDSYKTLRDADRLINAKSKVSDT